ncbi:hypothetical protein KR054_004413 [Drosophila jambulina]|nr:hypothetical protein KR054_004413 [Drosophila jambulina]
MAANSTKKSQSSGIRILWLPGRKSHSKDRISTTKEHISYSGPQDKSQMPSLGGSKAQSELSDLPVAEEGNVHAPSSLSLVATCSLAAQSGKGDWAVSETATLHSTFIAKDSPNLRPTFSLSEIAPSTSTSSMTWPNVITTAEVQDTRNIVSPEDLKKVPTATGETECVLKCSAGSTVSKAQEAQTTPDKIKYKSHNNNQEDINSIESISSFQRFQENVADFDWIDEMVEQRKCNERMHKNKQTKASKKVLDSSLQPEADQLDGQVYSFRNNDKAKINSSKGNEGDDEMVVKCLYYSLMCCDCRIS